MDEWENLGYPPVFHNEEENRKEDNKYEEKTDEDDFVEKYNDFVEKYNDLQKKIHGEYHYLESLRSKWERNGYQRNDKEIPIEFLDSDGNFNDDDYYKITELSDKLCEYNAVSDYVNEHGTWGTLESSIINGLNSLSEEFDNWQIELEKKRTERWYNEPLKTKEEDRLKKQLFTNVVELKEVGEKILKELKSNNEKLDEQIKILKKISIKKEDDYEDEEEW